MGDGDGCQHLGMRHAAEPNRQAPPLPDESNALTHISVGQRSGKLSEVVTAATNRDLHGRNTYTGDSPAWPPNPTDMIA
jgi:hypothetical protein